MKKKTKKQEPITLQKMVEAYGRAETAEIVIKSVNRTIIKTQRAMKSGEPVYAVFLKDLIPGRLEWSINPYLTVISKKMAKDGTRTQRVSFSKEEVAAMRRQIPNFDKFCSVKRLGYVQKG